MSYERTNGNKWLFSRITDYFDFSKKAIYTYSEEIACLSEADQVSTYDAIRARIIALDAFYAQNGIAPDALVSVVLNDLYRTMNSVSFYTYKQSDYLLNTARIFFALMNKRGFSIHLGTNNTFENPLAVTRLFPAFLEDCGFKLFDAYTTVSSILASTGESDDDLINSFARYKGEVLTLIDRKIHEANKNKENYAVILPDGGGNDFDAMLETIDSPGYLNYFKSEEAESPRITIFPFKHI